MVPFVTGPEKLLYLHLISMFQQFGENMIKLSVNTIFRDLLILMLIFGSRPKNVRQTGVTSPITAEWNSSVGTSCMIPIVYPKCRVPDVLQGHELFNKVTRLEITPDPEQSFLSQVL